MSSDLILTFGVLFYAVLWATTLGAFRPMSLDRSGIYILFTALGAGMVYAAHRLLPDDELLLLSLGKMLGESAYLALVLFLRSVRLTLSRQAEVRGSVAVLLATLLHLYLNLTLTGAWNFWVMAVQIILLFAWVVLEAYRLWHVQPSGITKMLLVLVCLHFFFELLGRTVVGVTLYRSVPGQENAWVEILNGWMYVTFSFGYVVLTATAAVLMDAFRSDKARLEQVVQIVEGRLRDKEAALMSLLSTQAARDDSAGVASFAHELNQPLTSIKLNAEYLTSGRRLNPDEVAHILQAILRENQRAASIVVGLRSLFINKVPHQLSTLTLSGWLTDWVQSRAPELLQKNGVILQLQAQSGIAIRGHAAKLDIVLQNLLNNAVEAMDGAGHVVISLTTDRKTAVIDVVDDGPGVPQSLNDMVFEMSFSTKPQGMGFGLWLCRRIAQQLEGDIVSVPSARGAHFRMHLPLSQP